MFTICNELNSLMVSYFDTKNVINMPDMFMNFKYFIIFF